MACRKLRRTQLVHEDTRLNEFAYKLQNRIQAALCGNYGVEWNNFLFVDQNDSSLTPQRGSLTDKYGTIQAAVDAAHEGDVIWINPGNYSENVNLSSLPDNVTIRGAGPSATIISGNLAGIPTLQFSPAGTGTPLLTLSIQDLSLDSVPNAGEIPIGTPLVIYCNNLPTSFDNGMFQLKNVRLLSTVAGSGCLSVFSCINNVMLENVYTEELFSSVLINNCGSFRVIDSDFRSVNADFDLTAVDQPSDGRKSYEFYQTGIADTLSVSHQCIITLDSECEVRNIDVDFVVYTDQGTGDVSDGKITCEGYVPGNVRGSYVDTGEHTEVKIIADFDHAEMDGTFHWLSGATNISWFDVVARNAVFNSVAANAISADGTNLGGLGNYCRMDISNSTFNQNALDVTSGDDVGGIDRSIWLYPLTAISEVAPGTPITIAPPFVTATYNVHYEVDVIGGSFFVILTSSKMNSSFNARASGAGAQAYITLVHQAYPVV